MFIYNGKNKKILSAVKKANDPYNRGSLKLKIRGTEFEQSSASSVYLAEHFMKFIAETNINVKTYSKRWSRALAYFTPGRPMDININLAKLRRSEASIIGTFYHESVHMFDKIDTDHEFGHGSNSSVGKENTFPYKVGSLVQDVMSESPTIKAEAKIARITIWGKIKRFLMGLF